MHLVRSNFEFESSGSAEISNLYVKFVKDLNCELNNGIVGRKVVISEIQGFRKQRGAAGGGGGGGGGFD